MLVIVFCCVNLAGCQTQVMQPTGNETTAELPELSDAIKRNDSGVPILNIYIKSQDKIQKMDIETYLEGVLAGEMKNDWPLEALKAQAILARTYTLKSIETKKSKYAGADISTDVTEAQAYNAESINDRIKQAVEETRGLVMTYNNELPYAWFHAHSGGMTELPSVALEYKEDPAYLSASASPESENAPEDVKNWSVTFTESDIIKACADCGVNIDGNIKTIELGKQGTSGRAASLIINGKEVSAPSFRIHIGADKLKSTLIDSVSVSDGNITFTGRGYGHGVGMSQWGAYALAEKGATAQTIVSRYFDGVRFVGLWE